MEFAREQTLPLQMPKAEPSKLFETHGCGYVKLTMGRGTPVALSVVHRGHFPAHFGTAGRGQHARCLVSYRGPGSAGGCMHTACTWTSCLQPLVWNGLRDRDALLPLGRGGLL